MASIENQSSLIERLTEIDNAIREIKREAESLTGDNSPKWEIVAVAVTLVNVERANQEVNALLTPYDTGKFAGQLKKLLSEVDHKATNQPTEKLSIADRFSSTQEIKLMLILLREKTENPVYKGLKALRYAISGSTKESMTYAQLRDSLSGLMETVISSQRLLGNSLLGTTWWCTIMPLKVYSWGSSPGEIRRYAAKRKKHQDVSKKCPNWWRIIQLMSLFGKENPALRYPHGPTRITHCRPIELYSMAFIDAFRRKFASNMNFWPVFSFSSSLALFAILL